MAINKARLGFFVETCVKKLSPRHGARGDSGLFSLLFQIKRPSVSKGTRLQLRRRLLYDFNRAKPKGLPSGEELM